ncbi:MAG: DUF2279 domain-containing protein [Ignavibacteriales bacterium]|nr:DUF2279 domain-containing protein [Ignavibacteriales bacterium]
MFTVPLFFVLSENTFSISDSVQTEKHEINLTRLAFVSGTAATFIVAGHIQNYDAWWKGDDKVHFHTGDADGRKVLHADKLGHNYFSFVMSDVVSHSFIWSGVERKNSFFYGGSIALLFQLYVEVEDGTHPELGFSVGDAIADVTGSYFPLMQNEYPFLKNITWKYSVIKTGNVGPIHKTVIDDYESQYFWLSAKLPQMIFGSENFFSKFFNIAIGYSVKNIYVQNKHSEIYLALDYDFEAIPLEGSFVNSVKHVLNYFHFPSPMIRITPSFVGYGFRW